MEKAIDRFYLYIKSKGLRISKLEAELKLSQGYISTQKKRGSEMSSSIIERIINNCPDLRPMWLIKGEGPMLKAIEYGDLSPKAEELMDQPEVYGSKDEKIKHLTERLSDCHEIVKMKDVLIQSMNEKIIRLSRGE